MMSGKELVSTWLATVLATLLAWWLSTHGLTGEAPWSKATAVCLIALSALKAGLIAWRYMEIRWAPRWLQALLLLWMSAAFFSITILYLSPRISTWLAGLHMTGV